MLGEELVDPGPLCPSRRALCDRTMLGRTPNILFFLVALCLGTHRMHHYCVNDLHLRSQFPLPSLQKMPFILQPSTLRKVMRASG
jgi:hypothetical protein